MNGGFVKNRQLAAFGEADGGSNFFYTEISVRAFKESVLKKDKYLIIVSNGIFFGKIVHVNM